MPKTNGGRWYTLNIGAHEVAFSTRPSTDDKFSHFLVMDRLILEFPETIMWIARHEGDVKIADYASAKRAVVISFRDNFARAERIFALPGIRRALVAYWADALADLREREAKSVYARYHSYDAVAELLEFKRDTTNVFEATASETNDLAD
jgi:hypothetical protein